MSTPRKREECGICHAAKGLIGPFVGGPCSYYCRRCHGIIQKWETLKKEQQDRFVGYSADKPEIAEE